MLAVRMEIFNLGMAGIASIHIYRLPNPFYRSWRRSRRSFSACVVKTAYYSKPKRCN
jgi:hypothetical protein